MASSDTDIKPGPVEKDVEQENLAEITESEDPELAAELGDVDLDVDVAENGAVIEVPVSYNDLESESEQTTDFIVEEEEPQKVDESDDEDADDPDFDPDFDDDDFDIDNENDEKPVKKKMKVEHNIEVEKCSICGATVADLAIHIVNIHSGNRIRNETPVIVRPKSPVG